MSNLALHLAERGISQTAFARQLGVHQSVVSRIVRGEIKPSLPLAVKIARETEGAVPVELWVDTPSRDTAA